MKFTIGTKLAVSFALCLSVFLVVGISSYMSILKLTEATLLVDHTHRVLESSAHVLSSLKDAETGQRGFVITGDEDYLQPYASAKLELEREFSTLRALTSDNASHQVHLTQIAPVVAKRMVMLLTAIDARRKSGFESAQKIVSDNSGKALMDEIRQEFGAIDDAELVLLKNRTEDEVSRTRVAETVIIIGTLGSVLLMALLGLALTRNIAAPLGALSEAARSIAAGDLRVALAPSNRSDEIGVLGSAFIAMKESLSRTTGEMQDAATVLASSASQILASTAQVASSAAETATAVAEITSTLEEVKQTSQLASQKTRLVSDNAQRASEVAHKGRRAVDDSIAGMDRIQQQMESITDTVVKFSEQSTAIGEIVTVVSVLAERSHLLAVNAAIEAARAGEHGRGFSVVAQEVKWLADQSKQATDQVRTILNDVQKAIAGAVMATEQGVKSVEAGALRTGEAGAAIRTLSETIETGAQAALQIAASSQEQSVGMDQVASAMDSIKQASSQNVSGMRQTEMAAKYLDEIGQKLKVLIGRYKV